MAYDPKSSLGCLASIANHMNERNEIMNKNKKEYDVYILYIRTVKDESNFNMNGENYKVNLRNIESSLYLPKNSITQGDILEFIKKKDSNILHCIYPNPPVMNDWESLYCYKHNQWYWHNVNTGDISWIRPTLV